MRERPAAGGGTAAERQWRWRPGRRSRRSRWPGGQVRAKVRVRVKVRRRPGQGNGQQGGGGGVGGGAGGGSGPNTVPADIPDGSDDDIVARQLREAAQKETDPELREKLWQEYRDYKKNTG